MGTKVRKAVAAGMISVLVLSGLSVMTAGQAGAATTPTVPASVEKLFDEAKLSTADLSPQWRSLINAAIKQSAPTVCGEIGNLATGFLKSTITKICLDIGKAKDPLAQLEKMLPTICALAPIVLPKYKTYIVAVCSVLV